MQIRQALLDYTLHLADNALILGHRNSEWTGHGPILEQDIALSNIALDLIGQARHLYQYAATQLNGTALVSADSPGIAVSLTELPQSLATEDSLAYLRDAWDFRNCLLVEQPNGDWARTILRQFYFSAYQSGLYLWMQRLGDSTLAAIAGKASKEVTYHLRWSSEWVIRLGDGTEESHKRMQAAIGELSRFTPELFLPAHYERSLYPEGLAVDCQLLRSDWEAKVDEVFAEATLGAHPVGSGGNPADGLAPAITPPDAEAHGGTAPALTGGKEGRHSEHLGYLLAEMQFLQRAYPGCEW